MVDQFTESSYLYYMEFTIDGKYDKMANFWKKLIPIQATSPVFQLQLLVKNCGKLNESDHVRYRKMLLDAQGEILPTLQSIKEP
jgi:hypothetical protein